MKRIFAFSFSIILLFGRPSTSLGYAVAYHTPVASTTESQPLVIVLRVTRPNALPILYYRTARAATEWKRAPFELKGKNRASTSIPGASVQPPALEYYIASEAPNPQRFHFASKEHPHRVSVHPNEDTSKLRRHIAAVKGRRAQVRFSSEWVDFGTREVTTLDGPSEIPDRYHRIETDFAYRPLRFPVHTIRLGYTRLIGTTPLGRRDDTGACSTLSAASCQQEAGYRVGGWFELSLLPNEQLALDLRGTVQSTPTGFNVGGRAEARFGNSFGSHFAVGTEAIFDVGASFHVRLAWDTVPNLPMAATVQLTNFPAPNRATAVRVFYDIAYPFENGLRVGLRGGYQAHDQAIGGPTLGLQVSYDFWTL